MRPKRGQPPLFAVYTLCHAGGAAEAGFRRALRGGGQEGTAPALPLLLVVDPPPANEEERPEVVEGGLPSGSFLVKETLTVREAAAVGGGRGVLRTAEYRRVMDDMSMPDNDAEAGT